MHKTTNKRNLKICNNGNQFNFTKTFATRKLGGLE